MFGLENNFYDNYWNFDNKKFIELLEKANKASYNPKKWKKVMICIKYGVKYI